MPEEVEEQCFRIALQASFLCQGQPRLRAKQNGYSQHLRHQHSLECVQSGIPMHPQHVKTCLSLVAQQPAKDSVVELSCPACPSLIPNYGQELVIVSVDQRNVPLHIDSEAFIDILMNRKVRCEEDC